MKEKIYSYDKLRGRIYEKYGTQEAFAKVLGISGNSLSLKMRCLTGFSQEDIRVISELLDIPREEYAEYFFA